MKPNQQKGKNMSATIDRSLEKQFKKDMHKTIWFTHGFSAGYLKGLEECPRSYQNGKKDREKEIIKIIKGIGIEYFKEGDTYESEIIDYVLNRLKK